MFQFHCPHCNEPVKADDDKIGTQARCPECHKALTIKKPVENAAAPAKPVEERPAAKPYDYVPLATIAPRKDEAPAEGPKGVVLGTSGRHREKRSRLWLMFRSLFRRGNPTDAGLVLTGLVAAAITWLIYFVIIWRLSADSETYKFFALRGWVQYATVFFTVWAGVVLALKYWKIANQQASLTYELFPTDKNLRITPSTVDMIEAHIKKLPVNPRKSFLLNRVLMALENFKARKNVPEVSAVLSSQSETDGAIVDSSYAMLKVLIWCIPILGFIGTVIGISQAVANFDKGISAKDANIEVIKAALGEVTTGLAVAFDTTYLGLILSMVIMFPTNSVQKQEEDLLSTIDQYCTENLLSRLDPEEPAPPNVHVATDALRDHEARLIEWQKRLENLETALLERVVETLGEVRKELGGRKTMELDGTSAERRLA